MVLAAALSLSATAACGGGGESGGGPDGAPDPGSDAAPSGVSLALGGADIDGTGFVPIQDGADVTMVEGAQGGFHVWTGMRFKGASGRLQLVREARRTADDALILRAPVQVIDVPAEAEGAWWQDPTAQPSFMCPSPIGIQVYDQEIDIHGTLYAPDGTTVLAEDDIILVPRCPEDSVDFCHEICSG